MVENFANKQNLNYMYQDKEQFYTLLLYCLVILGSAGGLLLLQYYSSLKNKGSLGVAIAWLSSHNILFVIFVFCNDLELPG